MYRLIGTMAPFKILKWIPLAIIVNPFSFMLSLLCFLSGVPLFLDHITPQSINALLPDDVSRVWGGLLVVGAGLQIIGSFMAYRRKVLYDSDIYERGLLIERTGLLILGYLAAIYAVCIVSFTGLAGIQAAVIVFAFAAVCWLQAFLIKARFTLAETVIREYTKGGVDFLNENFKD